MHVELTIGTLFAFLLVLARMAGALSFVPLPGIKNAPDSIRAALALALTIALMKQWPPVNADGVTPARLIGWLLAEAAVGISIGVIIAILLESFAMAAQIFGTQAGYGYASTIDPNSQADSGVLVVLAQLMGGMVFFTMGLDGDVMRLFAESLTRIPPGEYIFTHASAEPMLRLAGLIFSVGLRLALPVVALLLLVDIALALLGRVNAQLQLLTLAFPAKMLTGLLVLSWVIAMFPRLLRELAGHAFISAHRLLGL